MERKKLRQQLQAIAKEDKKEGMERYMRNQFPFLGVQSVARREVEKEFFKPFARTKEVPFDTIDWLWAQPEREFKYIALDLLKKKQKYLVYEDIPHLKQLILVDSWWDTVDVMDRIIGQIGLRDERVDDLMLAWSQDDDFWLRRIAIDHQLNRKEATNTELLTQIIENNLGSNEFFINKAIGWSLRQYSKTDADWVRDFIETHRDKLSPLSLREGSKYI